MRPVACPDCDLLHAQVLLRAGEKARCSRCAGALPIAGPGSFEIPLATSIAAAFAFWIANTEPLIRLTALGIGNTATIAGSAAALWVRPGLGNPATAILVAFCAMLAPAAWLFERARDCARWRFRGARGRAQPRHLAHGRGDLGRGPRPRAGSRNSPLKRGRIPWRAAGRVSGPERSRAMTSQLQ
ncbi:paraquat-inducible protein A [Ramlibacter sp.]|uniref:paraquat-inducible protein A n=1 Tax=Ramlibacter sp. TaxID=1917967 RepID=UPI002611586C|nr:paraquat-inducible protein A [Ramlibacter sp.]